MNLLEFAKKTVDEMNKASTGKEFAKIYISARAECFHKFQKGIITSSSHGINFFQNIIKYWDSPESYYTPDPKQKKLEPDYEQNFITLIQKNKNENL